MLTSGSRFGDYEIVALLGAGGMGEVYRARDSALGREVALKILPEHFAQDVDRLARFRREALSLPAHLPTCPPARTLSYPTSDKRSFRRPPYERS